MFFYDRNGTPVAYTDDGTNIFLVRGTPAAYICGEYVYAYDGRQLGWFEQGWVRDLQGLAVFFTDGAQGIGPVRPVKQVTPVKGVKGIVPVKGVRRVPQVRPVKSYGWSPLSGVQFF